MDGRLTFIHAPETPCLRCLFPEAPPPGVFPVLGATPGVIGCLQAMEAVKCLTGIGVNLKGRLLAWEGGRAEFRTYRIRRDPNCPVCGREA
jgi:adenylyltransferase/sulfurtransferase